MTVVVAAIEPNSIASQALAAEGVQHVEYVCRGDFGYGQMMFDLWARGEGFVLLEHDVVPWVGAVHELGTCGGDWCSLPYARSGSTLMSLGAVKFSSRLLKSVPLFVSEAWTRIPWESLDGHVLSAANALADNCEHGPAAGHVRRPD